MNKAHLPDRPVGGGGKKILYTLRTVQRMGVGKAAKALTSKNACKACAYGMGGQLGGMTNELGEFPSVCNKSVQAQSSDVQPAIPAEIFNHTLAEFRELSGREMETLGRLGNPIYKPAGGDKFAEIAWNDAIALAGERLRATDPERAFFYSSGRSSNEAGFLFQLTARLHGANNVNNCSYYCHQATSVALNGTIGTGTATVELDDLTKADVIFVIGANPSSNHPRFIHMLKACRDRGGDVVIINPAKEPGLVKFAVPKSPGSLLAGGTEIASIYLQPKIGSDIDLFKGIAKALIERGGVSPSFIEEYTDGYAAFAQSIKQTNWTDIEAACGIARKEIIRAAEVYQNASSAVFAWGMGMTHHRHGVENVEYISNLALLRGMIGRPGAGLLPLRGHSNVQGIGTIGVKPVLADDVIAKMEAAFGIKLPGGKGLDTMAAMQAASRDEIDACVVMGGNLFASNPDAAWAEKALGKIGFKLFLTTTLNKGHVTGVDDGETLILPVTARDEEWEPTTQESMFNFVRLSDGGITRLANVRPESFILADLAKEIAGDSGIDFDRFKQHKHLREAIANIVPGMEDLASIDVAKEEFHIRNRVMHVPVFRTPSGRAQFVVTTTAAPVDVEKAPFTLTSMRSEGQFNSIIYEEKDSYRQTKTRWCVLLNPEDIAALDLENGSKATMQSRQGKMESLTVYPFDVPRGNAMAYYPEANVLTATDVDPRSRTPSFKATPVWIERA